VILAVLLIVSLAIHVIQAVWTCRVYRRSKKTDTRMSPDCVLALDSNPCYEPSNVKQTEAQEAVHVYETMKQHN
jgi:methionyl-tRNA formyltransferase